MAPPQKDKATASRLELQDGDTRAAATDGRNNLLATIKSIGKNHATASPVESADAQAQAGPSKQALLKKKRSEKGKERQHTEKKTEGRTGQVGFEDQVWVVLGKEDKVPNYPPANRTPAPSRHAVHKPISGRVSPQSPSIGGPPVALGSHIGAAVQGSSNAASNEPQDVPLTLPASTFPPIKRSQASRDLTKIRPGANSIPSGPGSQTSTSGAQSDAPVVPSRTDLSNHQAFIADHEVMNMLQSYGSEDPMDVDLSGGQGEVGSPGPPVPDPGGIVANGKDPMTSSSTQNILESVQQDDMRTPNPMASVPTLVRLLDPLPASPQIALPHAPAQGGMEAAVPAASAKTKTANAGTDDGVSGASDFMQTKVAADATAVGNSDGRKGGVGDAESVPHDDDKSAFVAENAQPPLALQPLTNMPRGLPASPTCAPKAPLKAGPKSRSKRPMAREMAALVAAVPVVLEGKECGGRTLRASRKADAYDFGGKKRKLS